MRLCHSLCFALIALLYSLPTLATPLQPDPNWQIHQLDNGFQYRLYSVDETSDRVQIYLWVKSGAIDETYEQKGGAHLLEHMAFNGTKHFPGHKIKALFEQSGLAFGQDLNAYTSFKDTVYTLSIPENDNELMNEVLLYLSDVAQNITLDETEVAKEIGVVKGEYYARLGNTQDPDTYYMEKMSKFSGYNFKQLIGTETQIEELNASELKKYYRTWYRPNNMELLVVGNFNQEQLSQSIQKKFSHLEGQAPVKKRPAEPRFQSAGLTFSSEKVKQSRLSFNYLLPERALVTEQDKFNEHLIQFTNAMLSDRLGRANELADSAFLSAQSYIGIPTYVGNNVVFSLNVEHGEKQIKPVTHWLTKEVKKIQLYGFTEAELNQQKQLYLALLSQLNQLSKQATSEAIIESHLTLLQQQHTPISQDDEQRLQQQFIAQITLAKVNDFAKQVLVNPQKYQVTQVSHAAAEPYELEIWQSEAQQQDVKAYTEKQFTSNFNLSAKIQGQGEIINTAAYPQYGIETFTLANGLEILLQPDNTNKGEIYFHFSALGGETSLAPKYRAAAAMLADVQLASGLGEYSAKQTVQQFIAHSTDILPFINKGEHGLAGSTTNEHLEVALAGIRQAVSSTKIDEQMLQHIKQNFYDHQRIARIDTQNKLIKKALYGNNKYEEDISLYRINKLTSQDLIDVKTALFGSANGFKLTLVGDFEPSAAKQLINQYLGSLPSGDKHSARTAPLWVSTEKTERQINMNFGNRADLRMEFVYQGVTPSVKQTYGADLISRMLRVKLTDTVREELSLSYSPYAVCDPMVSLNYSHCRIQIVTEAKDVIKAKHAVEQILSNYYSQGVDATELSLRKSSLETAMLDTFKDPKSRAELIHRDLVYGYQVGEILEVKANVASIDKPYIDGLIKQMLQQAGQITLVNEP
ncbi:insulinase family protein [Motilimonas sp. 1_MG-2023]|uniref:M16 family metallopeptidase n=1 Tax=Motilimonas sp. 1_MG-2023 TaxID=3062672 RepID=UPI0026E34B33|nr:M16 family metallopeptidase [Motilimonas sp. 1_MG-2023]MDO6524100.1 insulinase family protein [Motilimonas sp. 1_MG-2023]